MSYGFKNDKKFVEISHKQLKVKQMSNKFFLHNFLAEGMYFLDKSSPSNLTCLTFHGCSTKFCVEKISKFMVFIFLENALNLGVCTHTSFLHLELNAEFLENLFTPNGERSGENYVLFYHNSIRKYEDDLEYQVVYISYDF